MNTLRDDEIRRQNRVCKVCKHYQYEEGDWNQICYYCRQSIKLRKQQAAEEEERWKEEHPLQNSLKQYFAYGAVMFFVYFVFVMPIIDFIDEVQSPAPPSKPNPTFYGYPCTGDCSGHKAGYEWAETNGINDASDCSGKSESFIEGCTAWTEMNW